MSRYILPPLLLALAGGPNDARKGQGLEQYTWQNRLLLAFAPSETYWRYRSFTSRLDSAEPELNERDLVVFHLFEDLTGFVFGDALRPELVNSLQEQYDPEKGTLTLVLIGKDGTEKARQVSSFDLEALFRRIDGMPMRQREMRRDATE